MTCLHWGLKVTSLSSCSKLTRVSTSSLLQPLSIVTAVAVLLETEVATPALLRAADALLVLLKVDIDLGVDVTTAVSLSSIVSLVTLRAVQRAPLSAGEVLDAPRDASSFAVTFLLGHTSITAGDVSDVLLGPFSLRNAGSRVEGRPTLGAIEAVSAGLTAGDCVLFFTAAAVVHLRSAADMLSTSWTGVARMTRRAFTTCRRRWWCRPLPE